jgi:hypothetical protein
MNYKITEVFLDEGGKYRTRVIINEETKETTFLKFDHYPTQEEVNLVINNYLNN